MRPWPQVALGDVLNRANESTALLPDREYHEVTIKLWGKGVVSRGKVLGGDVGTARRFVRANQLIMSKIDARNGAIGLVPPELDGAIVSNDFPSFEADASRVEPSFLGWLVRSAAFVELCRASSEGTTNRVRIKEDRFLSQRIALPSLTEQQTIVHRLDTLADKARQVTEHLDAIEADAARLLAVRFRAAIASATYRPMSEVAPSVRRTVEIDISTRYREVGARSFGKGLFTKPEFDGAEATWEKPVWIAAGDLVLSNIKAWEGAIAVASESHAGFIASHRYITCVPRADVATARFLTYFLLSPDGLEQVGLASPGTADRNRTLSLTNLGKIQVPVPSLPIQRAFDTLQSKIADLKTQHAAIRAANQSLIPATLERIFQQGAAAHAPASLS